jgi:hypothetical protein
LKCFTPVLLKTPVRVNPYARVGVATESRLATDLDTDESVDPLKTYRDMERKRTVTPGNGAGFYIGWGRNPE